MISSQKEIFFKAYEEGKNFLPIIQSWPADLETPLSTWLKLSEKDTHGVFLESVEGVLLLLNLFGKQSVIKMELLKSGILVKLRNIKETLFIY